MAKVTLLFRPVVPCIVRGCYDLVDRGVVSRHVNVS